MLGPSSYTALERLLHWLALEPASVRHLSFQLERQFALPNRSVPGAAAADGAVYVCGLARSGTTILLRILDEFEVFRSLTYRDMPFVLAPNLWRLITRHAARHSAPAERAHGDGILVDFDSPEGFEEVFWRTFGDEAPPDQPTAEALAAFADYRALVANPRAAAPLTNGALRRYLSKNNNNLLRLRSLCADPSATVLLAYRDPVATARSLHRQHLRFCAAQTGDRFTRTYMGWLAHHEFGLDHRPFSFALSAMQGAHLPDDPNYWLDYWIGVYSHVLAQGDLPLRLVDHDALRAEPASMLAAMFDLLGIGGDATGLARQIITPAADAASRDGFCPSLLQRADAIHQALRASRGNIAGRAGMGPIPPE